MAPFDQQDFELPSGVVTPSIPDDPVLRCLEKARVLLSDERHWSSHGVGDCTNNWCAVAAINRFGNDAAQQDAQNSLRAQIPRGYSPTIGSYNDNPRTTHADILALFDRAIAARRQQE